jgi:hypothetical protein
MWQRGNTLRLAQLGITQYHKNAVQNAVQMRHPSVTQNLSPSISQRSCCHTSKRALPG